MELNLIETLNLTQICRTCKYVAPQMRNLFEGHENAHQSPRMDEMLMACASVKVMWGDGLPAQICQICVEQLRNAFVFKRQVESIDAFLREYAKNIKAKKKQEQQNPNFCHKHAHTEKSYKCSQCYKQYTRLSQLQRHEESHTQKKVYACKICSRTVMRKESLERHLMTHLQEKSCSYNIYRDILTEVPIVENTDNIEEYYYQVDRDFVVLFSDSDIDEPNVEVMGSVDEDIVEEIVDTGLSSVENISETSRASGNCKNHHSRVAERLDNETDVSKELKVDDTLIVERNILEDGHESANIERDVPINMNSDEIEEVVDMRLNDHNNHVSSMEKVMECSDNEIGGLREVKSYQCPVCPKNFATESYRDIHVKMKHNRRRRYQRNKCEKTLLSRNYLKRHTQDNREKLLCPECGRRFPSKDSFITHMCTHRGEKPFKCKYCEKCFARLEGVQVHERYHTGEMPYLCAICGKGFSRTYNLTIHMRIHTGEKPHQCIYCNAAFTQRNALNTHIRRHTGERFQCELCCKGFLVRYYLNKHKRTVHGLNVIGKTCSISNRENLGEPSPSTTSLPKLVVSDTIYANTADNDDVSPSQRVEKCSSILE